VEQIKSKNFMMAMKSNSAGVGLDNIFPEKDIQTIKNNSHKFCQKYLDAACATKELSTAICKKINVCNVEKD